MLQLVAEGSKLSVDFDPHGFALSDAEKAKLMLNLEGLGRQAAAFPVADLHIYLEYNRHSHDHVVKLSLILPGTRLVTTDHDVQMHPAFERALGQLTENLKAYKSQLERIPDRQRAEKGTVQQVEPGGGLDAEQLAAAVGAGDYAAFRVASLPYEESVRKRVGRWIERYPEMAAQVGKGLQINDVVESVFLSAFESYDSRPHDLRFGDWLDGLIDPAVKALRDHRDAEMENINNARSAVEAQGGPGLV